MSAPETGVLGEGSDTPTVILERWEWVVIRIALEHFRQSAKSRKALGLAKDCERLAKLLAPAAALGPVDKAFHPYPDPVIHGSNDNSAMPVRSSYFPERRRGRFGIPPQSGERRVGAPRQDWPDQLDVLTRDG